MKFFKDTIRVWWCELCQACRDQGVILFCLVVPLGYPILYYTVYCTEIAVDVDVAIVDEDHSSLSRQFIRKFDAAQEARVKVCCQDIAEAQEMMKRREVYGVVRIPRGFSKDVAAGRRTFVGVYTDVGSMIYYKNVLLPATFVIQDMNKDIKVEHIASNLSDREMAVARQPILYNHVRLYNPQDGYAAFLIPPILMLIIQQTLLIGIGMGMGRTREQWCGNAIPPLPFYHNPAAVVVGKILVFLPIYLVMALYMYSAITWGFGLPRLGHYTTWLAFIIPYLISCCSFGVLCSGFMYRREDPILIFVCMSVPLIFVSGVSWPSSAIPDLWRYVGCLFPSTFGCNAHTRITCMGADITAVRFELIGLWVQSAVYFTLACILQHYHTQRSDKRVVISKAEEIMRTPKL